MKAPFLPFFLLLLLISSSGCFSVRPAEKSSIQWGLGLDLEGQALPPPGPFLEGTENVTALAQALNTTLPQILKGCHAPRHGALEGIQAELDRNNLLYAIVRTLMDCEGDWGDRSGQMAASANTTETRLELYLLTRARATAALQREADLLSSLEPGSVLDAEVQAILMSQHAWQAAAMQTAEKSYAAFNTTAEPLDWDAALSNLLPPIDEEAVMRAFVQTFPWTPGTCSVPDMEPLKERTNAQIHQLLNDSATLPKPSQYMDANQLHHVTEDVLEDFQHYSSRDWWQALLGIPVRVGFYQGVLATYSSNVLPTQEEAQFLFAQYRHTNRTLRAEWWMVTFEGILHEEDGSWEQFREFEARQTLALGSRGPPSFTLIQCSSTAAQ